MSMLVTTLKVTIEEDEKQTDAKPAKSTDIKLKNLGELFNDELFKRRK